MVPEVRFEASARGIRNRSDSTFTSSLQTLALARRSRTRVSSALISKGSIAGAPFDRMVPEVRFELTRYRYRRILSPLRLPFRHSGAVNLLIVSQARPLCLDHLNKFYFTKHLHFIASPAIDRRLPHLVIKRIPANAVGRWLELGLELRV